MQFHRILIAHQLGPAIAERLAHVRPDLGLRQSSLRDVTADDVAWADVIVGFRRPAAGLGNARWVHCIGAGVDAWLKDGWADGVLLTRTTESFAAPIGEWVTARLLAVTQDLRRLDSDQRNRTWDEFTPRLLAGTHALIVGTGDVGQGIAERLSALGVQVTGFSRTGNGRRAFSVIRPISELPRVISGPISGCLWIILAAPLTDQTRRMVNRDLLQHARGAWLVNVARGELVDEEAVLDALNDGHLAGAALDVFTTEPLPADSPLWSHPNVITSPHIAGVTTVDGAVRGFLQALDALERGERPARVVDPQLGY